MTVASLVPRLREALGVSSSYDEETIPSAIRDSVASLLRDYNFPKSLRRKVYTQLAVDQQSFSLPAGFKRLLAVRFYDPSSVAWTDPLERRDGPVMPQANGIPSRYWLEGLKLWIDTPLSAGYENTQLQLWYQSQNAEENEDWMTEDFRDVLFYMTAFNLAPELRKPEVAQAFGPIYSTKIQGLAIYLNELEFDGMEMSMREEQVRVGDRYPAGRTVEPVVGG